MGDRHNFPLRPYAVANLEDGRDGNPAISKVKTALAIKLEFASESSIYILAGWNVAYLTRNYSEQ